MYDNVADIIKNADIAFINQESPFGGDIKPTSGYPLFNSPDEVGYDLAELGFDVIGIANNHMLDSTTAGYKRTIEFWENFDDVFQIGGYKNKQDFENIKVIEKNGIKIAFLAYTYGTNGLTLASGSDLYVPLYNDDDIDRQTKKARELADAVIVSIHWGTEDHFKPGPEQTRKAQIMIDNGVDVIIGHHPHVLQPMQWADRKDGGRTLLMYSLGNFLSGMMYSRNMVGGIMGFDIIKAPNGTSVENAYFIPTVCQYNYNVREFKIYKFSEYTEELEKAHGAHKFDSSMSYKYMKKIITDEIPDEFLIEDFYRN
jgi:poly-gamma-glutamate synthesis protein (capsule biosynthesis protein)